MHKKCGSEVVIDHRDDRTFESDVKEQGDEEFYREQVIPLYSVFTDFCVLLWEIPKRRRISPRLRWSGHGGKFIS